jgi:general secretion pathway protein E
MDKLIREPHGIVLVTGPTGSGKTTTLYASLSRLDPKALNIMTVEDPIEYDLDGISQTQINTRIEMSFARALRTILRQDPDVVMIGEIRDLETAQIAVQASLTGHLVFATLHTNDSVSAVTRLVDMGVEPFLVSSSLNLVMAQRLVRKVCPHCASPVDSEALLPAEDLDFLRSRMDTFHFREGAGCEACSQFGYLGRTAIHEFMLMSDLLRPLVLSRASTSVIRDAAIQEGMLTLWQDGLLKAAEGITTIPEVLRVTEESE